MGSGIQTLRPSVPHLTNGENNRRGLFQILVSLTLDRDLTVCAFHDQSLVQLTGLEGVDDLLSFKY